MSVYRHRKSPWWQFDFVIQGYRFSGSTEVAKSRPKRDAQAAEETQRRAAERLVEAAHRAGREPMTLALACERWWNEAGQHGQESDLKTALDWLRDQIGGRQLLHSIGNDDVSKAIAERRRHLIRAGRDDDGKPLLRPITARTVNRTVPLLLRRIMRRARDLWEVVIFKEPAWKDLRLAEVKRPVRELSLAEEEAIAALEGSYGAIRRLTVIMGLRLAEALLSWPQVDFENAQIRIVGKGGEPAIVPMSREAYALLWAERGRHPLHVFTFVAQRTRICPKTGQRYVKGARYPITYWGLTSHRRRAWPQAGVAARYHDLRHTAGMRTLRATGNLKVTQKLLRHADITTTSRFYVDALVEDVRAAMETTEQSRIKSRTGTDSPAKSLTGK